MYDTTYRTPMGGYEIGLALPPTMSYAFGATEKQRADALNFADVVRNSILSGNPMPVGEQTKDDAAVSQGMLPHKPAWMPQSVWKDVSDYVLLRQTDAYARANAGCSTQLTGSQARDCRRVVRDAKRHLSALRRDPEAESAALWGPNRTVQVAVSSQDFADYRIVTGQPSPSANTMRTLMSNAVLWADMRRQAGEIRQAFGLPIKASAVPGYEGVPAAQILAGAAPNVQTPSQDQDWIPQTDMQVSQAGFPVWVLPAFLVLGGLGALGALGWWWLHR